VRAKALSAAGTLAWAQGDFARAAAYHEASREQFTLAGDAWGLAFSLYSLANQVKMQGEFARAEAMYEASLERFLALDDDWAVATLRHALALLALDTGDLARADRMLVDNAPQARRVGDRWLLAASLCGLGNVAARLGDFDRADPLLAEAHALFCALGERRWTAHTRSLQGLVTSWRGDRVAAWEAYRDALAEARTLGVRFYVAEILERMAALLAAGEEAMRAARFLGAADALREAIAAPPLPLDRTTRDEAARLAQETLGGAAWQAAWTEGRGMALEQVIVDALALDPTLVSATSAPAEPALCAHSLGLTPRENEVLQLLHQRLTDSEIADRLFISRRTASAHVASILGKLGATNRREVTGIATRYGLP
jgi:non-specific serine/threonine protein kinase